jgi:hypothetical protein
MTADEVAGLLRTSRKGVYCMAERGLLPGMVRVQRRLLFDQQAIVRWLEGNRVEWPSQKCA